MWEKAAVIANFLLVIVGGAGVIVAWVTLRKLERQTKAAEDATKATQQTVETGLIQTRAMKDRERARLVVRGPSIPELLPSLESLKAIVVDLYVANEGTTKAFNARAYAVLNIVSSRDGGPYEIGPQQEFPGTLSNTDNVAQLPKIDITSFGPEFGSHIHVDSIIEQKLRAGKLFIQVSGMVTYMDIYDDSHESPFKYIWVSAGDDDGARWLTRSTWYDLGVTKRDVDADRIDQNPGSGETQKSNQQ